MATVRMYRGHWVADYYDANQRRRIERPEGYFEKAREELQAAQVLLADRVAEVADGLVHKGRGTFEDAAIRWLKSKVRIRPSTRRSYEHLLVCYLIPYFGDRKLRLIQVTDVERFRAELSQGIPDSIRQACITRLLKAKPGLAEARAKQRASQVKLGRRSINKALTVLSMVFNYAVRNQWMIRNPAEYVDHARDDRPIEQRPLDMDVLKPEEIAALREAARPATYRDGKLATNNYRLLISFAVFTGFQEPKTRTSYRRLSLPTFLLKELKVWRLACPHSPYDLIFPNLEGLPMSYSNLITRGFHPARKRAGIRRIRFHDLRHTFASLMISNGEDIVRVSRLMGHATASFTLNVYSHMIPSDRLASLVFGNKMETVANLPTQLERPSAENLSKSA